MAELAALGELGDEDACLDYLRDLAFPPGTPCPKCERLSRFHRVRGRSAYSCQYCGSHVYPTAGTIFRRSTTDLRTWFRAIQLVGSRPGEVTARELEDELGVTRPTASRMLTRITPVVEVGPERLFLSPPGAQAPEAMATTLRAGGKKTGKPAEPGPGPEPVSSDLVRDELLATLVGLQEDLRAAELKAAEAQAEIEELRGAVAAIEQLAAGHLASPAH